MPLTIGSTSTGPGIRYDLLPGTDFFGVAGTTIISTDNDAIRGNGSDHRVTVLGTVYGQGEDGIDLGSSASDTNLQVDVMTGGSVGGHDDAIELFGYTMTVRNLGTVFGGYGVSFYGDNTSVAMLYNAGSIDAFLFAVYVSNDVALRLVNFGTIAGNTGSVTATGGNDRVINRGLMVGDILLTEGNDTFDNRGGRLEGEAALGAGTDTFLAGGSSETVSGGADLDTLDFRSSGGVTVWLSGAGANTGVAAGDTYYDFEIIHGSQTGRDRLYGDLVANTLNGNGGKDRLSGFAGDDWLNGGDGKDTLQGGAGDDTFILAGRVGGADVITDFRNAAGNNDVFYISSGFGGIDPGPLAAGQFVARADRNAQDADDRFIFRTTDTTLWFDGDGNGAGAAIMIANLQAGATMAFDDIFIF